MEKPKMDKNKCPFSKNPKYFWKKQFTSLPPDLYPFGWVLCFVLNILDILY
jgi:hypothetical protein